MCNIANETIRFLEKMRIEYELKYTLETALTCKEVSRVRDCDISKVLKCMVAKGHNNKTYIIMLSGDKKIDMRKIRKLVKDKTIDLCTTDFLCEKGLVVGAVTPFAFINKAEFYLDNDVANEDVIDISSGDSHIGVKLRTKDLVKLIDPIICDFTV